MCTCQFSLLSAFLIAASSCAVPAPLNDMGEVELPLRTTTGATTYELRDASFVITGPTEVTLNTEDAPESLVLEQTLPEGDYVVTLQPDWRLFDVTGDSPVEIDATLVTENPVPFSIQPHSTTLVSYQFEIDDGESIPGGGGLQITMEVTVRQSGPLVFTELMRNPSELADAAGEWVELQNTGAEAVDLNGCVLQRDATQTTIGGPLEVAPGGVITLANGATPGFEPDYVYSSVTLPNSALFELSLLCDGALVDRIVVDPSTIPDGSGVAASLSSDATSVSQNDSAANWCAATGAYSSDLGSPGSPNPPCG